MRAMESLFAMTAADTAGSFLPQIRTTRRQSVPRQVVTGKGLDDLYTKRNTELLKLQDENKNYITENNQLKVVNEKLIDRLELYTSIIEKEASANTYYYNYPPKADNTLIDEKNKKSKSGADGEG
jgi:regulator of replication initiation timing